MTGDTTPELILKKTPSCSLCNNNKFREWDEIIFSRKYKNSDIKANMAVQNDLIVEEHEIRNHLKHLHLKETNIQQNIFDLEEDISKAALDETNDITILQARINMLRLKLIEYEKQDDVGTHNWIELTELLDKLIEKKNKLLGLIPDNKIEVNVDLTEFWNRIKNQCEGIKNGEKK